MPLPFTSFGNLSIEQFLQEYWQQKPLLIRQAIPDFTPPLSAEELAGLALEADVESRIILEKDWQLRCGPFTEQDFEQLPESRWTLLVQAVDQWVPEVKEILDYFRFLPNWRLDDIMISYAADQGSVGPHYDNYDVFLLQAEGTRQWQLGQYCDEHSPVIPGTPLRILSEFDGQTEYTLEPGDMLYLPPQLAHWGIAQGDDCMTYSIGFRAPSHGDLLAEFSHEVALSLNDTQRYCDPKIPPQQNPGELTPAALEQVQSILKSYLDQPEKTADWFGRYMTMPKYVEQPDETGITEQVAANIAINPDQMLSHAPGARFAYHTGPTLHQPALIQKKQVTLFADGCSYQCSLPIAELICAHQVFSINDLMRLPLAEETRKLIVRLLIQGSLEVIDE